ncbi:MAG: matrixin family metalloprotease [Proteobacteria bacterium]|nr:matrixin family metalloprotease [Pseudomonadota bacterium]
MPPRKLVCLIFFLAALLAPIEAYSGVYFMSPGKWRDGRISWRYNPAGIAPGADEAAILATVQRAFDAWSAVCNISAEYSGSTTTTLDQTSARSEVVMGYAALPYPQAADAAPDSEDSASNYTYFTSGKIRISTSIGAAIQYNPNVLVHEIGHLLGLDHSDDPYSIMYANPYNAMPALAPYELYGDDITTCANLYGGKGIRTDPGYGNSLPADSKGAAAKLEIAAIVEQDGTGAHALRLFNYSAVGIDYSNAYLDGSYARNIKTFIPAPGDNALEVWVKSTLPRYAIDLAHNIGGQSARTHDLVRQLNFTAGTAGTISGNRIDTVESGTLAAYSARGNIQTTAIGAQQIYVAALLGTAIYFRTAQGWSAAVGPLLTLAAPGAVNFDILRDFDARALPSGTALYVGYGASVDEMLARQQFKRAHAF